MRIATDRVFRAASEQGTAAPDAGWGARAAEFFGRGNTVSIAGRELDSASFRRILNAPYADRARIAAEVLRQPGLDWDDTKRFLDDVMVANPSARGQRFGVNAWQAKNHGLLDTQRAYGGRSLEVAVTARAPAAAPAVPAAPAPRTPEQSLRDSSRFQQLSEAQQTALLAGLASAPSAERATALTNLIEEPNFGALSRADQTRVLDVARELGTGDLGHLRTVLDRSLDGPSGLRARGLPEGSPTMLDSLHRLATGGLHERVDGAGIQRGELLGGVVREIAIPRDIDQGPLGMCGTTSVQYGLVRRYPAEYARIVEQLSTQGRVTMADGSPLALTETNLRRGPVGPNRRMDTRSPSERIFQGSLANGVYASANGGIYGSQTADQLSRLFDRDYTVRSVRPEREPTTLSRRVDIEGATAEELVTHLRTNPRELTMVAMRFGEDSQSDRAHALTFDHAEGGRIYLRNPWGSMPEAAYDGRGFVRVEDASRGLISVSEAEFRARVIDIVSEDR